MPVMGLVYRDTRGRLWSFVDGLEPIGWRGAVPAVGLAVDPVVPSAVDPPVGMVHDGAGVYRCPEYGVFTFDPSGWGVHYLGEAEGRRYRG